MSRYIPYIIVVMFGWTMLFVSMKSTEPDTKECDIIESNYEYLKETLEEMTGVKKI